MNVDDVIKIVIMRVGFLGRNKYGHLYTNYE